MPEKDRKSLEENITKYEDYFQDDLNAIEEELLKSKEYSKIIDAEIEKLSGPTLGSNKTTTRYLVDIIANAVQLQSQRQGLRKDRFAIKKAIMDYAAKFADNKPENSDPESNSLASKIAEIIEQDRAAKKNETIVNDDSLDNEIDDIIGEDEEK